MATTHLLDDGEVIDGWAVGERIHSGGMGAIYRVSGPAPFPVVMKVPRLGPGEPASTVVSYEVEELVLGALRGPHAPRLVAAGDLERRPFLVIEEIEGRSLSEWVGDPVAPEEVARLGAALATSVHALHAQDAIHLDLKPSNVMIRPSGEAVLVDFGLARHAHFPDLLAEEFRRPVGSAPYISPEQVLGMRDDPRSDVFALGVILYELATGELPFGSPRGMAGLRRRLWRDPVPPRALVPAIPPALQEVILHCLEPRASGRTPTAAQVAFELTHLEQVAVGERGERRRRAGLATAVRRWIAAAGAEASEPIRPSAHLAGARIVMAAVATAHGNEAQFEALRRAVMRLLPAEGPTRVACVTVIPPSPELGGSSDDDNATSHRIQQLVRLRHWAEPMQLAASRLSFHVLESADPAGALLEYARANQVDHLVIGAPPPDMPLKALLGTVATKVAIEAPCTVTVVRAAGSAPRRPRVPGNE